MRRSIVALFALAPLVACRNESNDTSGAIPERGTTDVAVTSTPWFEDATDALGIDFVHDAGETGEYFMPEAIGSGLAVFDFDADGRLDLYLLHGAGRPESRNRLYRQGEDGRFVDVSAGSGLDVHGRGMGCAAGDLDHDGLPELVLTEYGRTRLFWNRGGGRFEELGTRSGVDNPAWGTSAAFVDFDRDGWLDLFVTNYVLYSGSRPCSDPSGRRDYCGPSPFPPTVDRLFRNTTADSGPPGEPRFEDVTIRSGLAAATGPGLGVVAADFDGDRRVDFFVANDGKPNHLWIQRPDGTFVEEAVFRGLAYNAEGRTQADMGIALGDVDDDGLFDVYVTHLTEELHSLWRQAPRGSFRDDSGALGFASMRDRRTGFGAVLADLDLDGDLDLAQANGRVKFHLGPSAEDEPFWAAYREPNQLFENTAGRFVDVSAMHPAFCAQPNVARGLVAADLDNDGDLDLVVSRTGDRTRVYRNVARRRGRWLSVRATDPRRGGRDDHGAEVRVRTRAKTYSRVICPSQSYLVSGDPRAHFGLGKGSPIESIEVLWSEGEIETFPAAGVDRLVVLEKGTGQRAKERPR